MKYLKFIILLCLPALMLSCNDDEQVRAAEALRAQKYNDSILTIINKNWKFNIPPVTPKVKAKIDGWNEWQQFKAELADKPTGSLNAYRGKVKAIAEKAEELNKTIPPFFNQPQMRSRLGVLMTKVRSLYTYIDLTVVQEKKVIQYINEISKETTSIQNQMDEMVRFSEIPMEKGEEELLMALDTVRMANPDMIPEAEKQPAPAKPKKMDSKKLKPFAPPLKELKPKTEN